VKKVLVAALLLALAGYAAFGVVVARERTARHARADERAPGGPRVELRGAYHVHTTASDGRGTLDEVVAAAEQAGLDFVVVTDHNVRFPERAVRIGRVLVVPGTEVSTPFGHVVALGVPRALTPAERERDPLGAIAALGGEAVLAHPFHPRRPFTGWGRGAWRGLEIVSNDTAWHRVLGDRDVGRFVRAALALPWDGGRAVLALQDDPGDELARFDAELRDARRDRRRPARVLLCSADAHGYPSYRAAFEAFSMHVPVAPTGDAAADAAAVTAALLDGTASCVLDGVAPARHVRLTGSPGALSLHADAELGAPAELVLLRDGEQVGLLAPDGQERGRALFHCGGACPPGDYRVEVRRGGRPWIFTNPVTIE
jgi:hypothetical protein